jgi:cytochrome oxidase Cu insertion factor (SCO1/SenC/PrrC family)
MFGCVDYKKVEDLLKAYQKLTGEINLRKETFMHDKSHHLMNARDQFRRKLNAFIQTNS